MDSTLANQKWSLYKENFFGGIKGVLFKYIDRYTTTYETQFYFLLPKRDITLRTF